MARSGQRERKQRNVDPLLDAVGKRVTHFRTVKSVSPASLARTAGFSLQYLWRLEDGQLNITLKTMARIAIALDIPMAALLEHIDPGLATIEVDIEDPNELSS